jgi:hypothetical protein
MYGPQRFDEYIRRMGLSNANMMLDRIQTVELTRFTRRIQGTFEPRETGKFSLLPFDLEFSTDWNAESVRLALASFLSVRS